MRWSALALVSFVACHRHPAPVQRETAADAADATRPPPAASAADAGASSIVDRWNDAHARRDAQALEAVYAPNVSYYGTELTSAECVRRKAAAFAKTPDFTQSIRDVKLETTPDGKDTWARFEKTTTSGGKAKSYRACRATVACRRSR